MSDNMPVQVAVTEGKFVTYTSHYILNHSERLAWGSQPVGVGKTVYVKIDGFIGLATTGRELYNEIMGILAESDWG